MDPKSLETKTFYEVLGVPIDASTDQIKEVYRDLARAYHPDSNFYSEIVPQKANTEQVQFFKILTAAYNTLVDASKRAEYDSSIKPLIALRQRVKDWEAKDEDFQPSRPLVQQDGASTTRTRRMTSTFGKREFFEQAPMVEEPPPPPKKIPTFTLYVVGLGIIAGMFAGAAAYYLFLLKH
jgi:DnaJ-class molecular chaperone